MYSMVNILSIMSKLEEWSAQLKEWIMANYTNPVLWVGIVAVGFLFFKVMFSTLNKD